MALYTSVEQQTPILNEKEVQVQAYLSPSIYAVPISNTQGEQAMLGWLTDVHGHAGPVPLIQVVFRDENTSYEYLRESDYVLSSEQANVSDEQYPIVILDKRISSWVGGARQSESGGYEGFVACGMHALDVSRNSVRDFASDVYAAILEAEKY